MPLLAAINRQVCTYGRRVSNFQVVRSPVFHSAFVLAGFFSCIFLFIKFRVHNIYPLSSTFMGISLMMMFSFALDYPLSYIISVPFPTMGMYDSWRVLERSGITALSHQVLHVCLPCLDETFTCIVFIVFMACLATVNSIPSLRSVREYHMLCIVYQVYRCNVPWEHKHLATLCEQSWNQLT